MVRKRTSGRGEPAPLREIARPGADAKAVRKRIGGIEQELVEPGDEGAAREARRDVGGSAARLGRHRLAHKTGAEHALESARLAQADLAPGMEQGYARASPGAAWRAVERARRADDGLLVVARTCPGRGEQHLVALVDVGALGMHAFKLGVDGGGDAPGRVDQRRVVVGPELEAERVGVDEGVHVAAEGDVHACRAEALHLECGAVVQKEAVYVVERDGADLAAFEGNRANHESRRRVEADLGHGLDQADHAGGDDSGRGADDAVAAHGNVDVLFHDDGREVGSRPLGRKQENRAHHGAAARLEVEHAANAVVVGLKPGPLLEKRRAGRHPDAADDDAGRIALGVGIDRVDRAPVCGSHVPSPAARVPVRAAGKRSSGRKARRRPGTEKTPGRRAASGGRQVIRDLPVGLSHHRHHLW